MGIACCDRSPKFEFEMDYHYCLKRFKERTAVLARRQLPLSFPNFEIGPEKMGNFSFPSYCAKKYDYVHFYFSSSETEKKIGFD